ncbi:MAG: PAC2 family protein [Phycisphaeraceae bacterium]|nr:PAC2 family protein [Phycisphaeraceae bacterium]
MPDSASNPKRPWLIAAWPGMGNVAVIAAGYVAHRLGLKNPTELSLFPFVDIDHVDVSDGLIARPRMPRGLLFSTRAESGRELLFLIGEAQPSEGVYTHAQSLIEDAGSRGVERIITFASLASQIHPEAEPSVYGAATTKELLSELDQLEVGRVEDGQIGGLNGVMLGAAAERDIPAMCLLAEFPFFAANVPNPKAACAILETFSTLADFPIDLTDLRENARIVQDAQIRLMEELKNKAGEDDDGPEFAPEPQPDEPSKPKRRPLDQETRAQIEKYFDAARRDRARAVQLKDELDRLGVFEQYEDRFLDLFKRAD